MKQTILNKITQNYSASRVFVRDLSYSRKLLVALILLVASYGAAFFTKNIEYAYGNENCTVHSTVLPGLFRSFGEDYRIDFRDELKLGGTTLVASSVCFIPLNPPAQNPDARVAVSLLGTPLFYQSYRVNPEELPKLNLQRLDAGVAATRPLKLPLSHSDTTHVYKLAVNNKNVNCSPQEQALECDIRKLELRQGAKYNFVVERYFQSQRLATVQKTITTLSPVSVIDSSVKPAGVIYDKPTTLELKTDKKLTKAKVKLYRIEGDKRTEIPQTSQMTDKGVLLKLTDQLPRASTYQLHMSEVEAIDGSSLLEEAYILPFTVSGGPKVTGVNIGKTGVLQSATVVITFDQALSPDQDIAPLVSFKGGTVSIAKQANQILLKLGNMPLCGDFTITLGKEIKSAYDVSGDSAWTYGARTICHSVSTIGYTVKGRAITAYQFGSGATAILYVGAMHGNEAGTYSLMSAWIDNLEANARAIPADKKVIVVPAINRDGLAAKSRRNASNVDLNRNFPTADWKADVTMPGGELVKNGGGATSLSEPESRAIANFTLSLSPRLVLTYHSTGSLVSANEAGGSVAAAAGYAQLSRYWNAPKSSASTTFEYDTTGAYEDWLYERPGIGALLVELSSHTSSEYNRNQRAMWEMVRL